MSGILEIHYFSRIPRPINSFGSDWFRKGKTNGEIGQNENQKS